MYIVAPVWIGRGGTSYLLKSAQLQRLHLHAVRLFCARVHTHVAKHSARSQKFFS